MLIQRMPRRLSLRAMPGGWWLDVALVAGLIAVTVALIAKTPLIDLDVIIAHWCDDHRPRAARIVVRALNLAGQGWVLELTTFGVAAWRARASRSIRPVLVGVAAYGLTAVAVGPVKILTDRAAPHKAGLHREWLLAYDKGMSYPSGHVVNAIVWYVALAIVLGCLLPRQWWLVLRVAPAVLIVVTTTYLGYHWATDGVAGAIMGVLVARMLLRIPWDEVPLGRVLARRGWDGPADLGVPGPRVRPPA